MVIVSLTILSRICISDGGGCSGSVRPKAIAQICAFLSTISRAQTFFDVGSGARWILFGAAVLGHYQNLVGVEIM